MEFVNEGFAAEDENGRRLAVWREECVCRVEGAVDTAALTVLLRDRPLRLDEGVREAGEVCLCPGVWAMPDDSWCASGPVAPFFALAYNVVSGIDGSLSSGSADCALRSERLMIPPWDCCASTPRSSLRASCQIKSFCESKSPPAWDETFLLAKPIAGFLGVLWGST